MVLAVREGEWVPKNLSSRTEVAGRLSVAKHGEKQQEEERGNRRGAEEPDVSG